MNEFQTLDSGKRETFDTGAKRDTQEGKPRYDLMPLTALKRTAMLYARGAEKYDEWNWSKGMPASRFYASLQRHAHSFAEGDRSEDHLAGVVFNAFAMMHFDEVGPDTLNDMPLRPDRVCQFEEITPNTA